MRRRDGTRAAAALAAAAAITAATVGTLTNGPTTRLAARPAPAAAPSIGAGIDYANPTAVCAGFVTTLDRRDTRTDASPLDAHRRTAAFLAGELAAAMAAGAPGRGPQWTLWRAYGAASNAVTALMRDRGDAQPADTAPQAYWLVRTAFTPVGVDGRRGPVSCTLRRTDAGWRIEQYDLVPAAGTP